MDDVLTLLFVDGLKFDGDIDQHSPAFLPAMVNSM